MTKTVDADLATLKGFFRAETDSDLARELGVADNTVAMWRKRGVLPEKQRCMVDVAQQLTGEFEENGRPPVPSAFDQLTRLPNLERQAFKVGLVRFISEHSGFGHDLEESLKVASDGPEALAAYCYRAYLDLIQMRVEGHHNFADAAAILMVRHLRAADGTRPDKT